MATVHMICGPVGAGKTTYGRAIANERNAVFFCLDEWMATLYTMDAPKPLTLEWMLPRCVRAEQQIWSIAQQIIASGVDVVIELGFFTRDQRRRIRELVAAANIELVVYLLEVPRDVRRERVRARNRGSATLTIEVDDATFDWAENYYEPFDDDELASARVIRG